MPNTDFLVIGSGIAGLTYAVKVAQALPDHTITVITKSDEEESNTRYAQGGIAVVLNEIEDSFDKHIKDTLRAGDGLCDEKVVDFVVKEGPERFWELVNWGGTFDETVTGEYDLGKEGGHTVNRIVHHKDMTGYEMERTLLEKIHSTPNIEIFDHYFAIDLITEHQVLGKVTKVEPGIHNYGAYFLDRSTGKIDKFVAKITLLATGGAGQVYQSTTNPVIATGDGLAMAYRAKAELRDMEFIQFHPTALYQPGKSPTFLISEAVRGVGAKLRTKDGKPFMHKYDEREELASRDIVAKAIDTELKKRGDHFVYLDCRALDQKEFAKHFPTILEKCKKEGFDPSKDMIPVTPAAHYLCGGIVVDEMGKTTMEGLYACGECSRTGLHGANRLASNSLLEALVFAHRCFLSSIEEVKNIEFAEGVPDWNTEGTSEPEEMVIMTHNKLELQAMMSDYVGIVRSDDRLKKASRKLHLLYEETKDLYNTSTLSPQLCELRNLITCAYTIIQSSMIRKENRGGFFNKDLAKDEK